MAAMENRPCAKLARFAERNQDGDDLVRRSVKRYAEPTLTQTNLVQWLLVRPGSLRGAHRLPEVPRAAGRPVAGVVAPKDQAVASFRRFQGGKDQAIAFQSQINRVQVERRGLAQPDTLRRKKEIFPQVR